MESDRLFDDRVIDLKPGNRRRRWLVVAVVVVLAILLFGSKLIGIYVDALWFNSLGFSQVYWYKFRIGGLLFLVFLVVSFALVRLPFVFLNRLLPELTERPRLKISSVEDLQEINFLPVIYRPGIWILASLVAIVSAINMSQEWPAFALYLHSQPVGSVDPIFGRDVAFYLFELPVLELISGWFQVLATLVLAAVALAAGYVWYLDRARGILNNDTRRRVISAISVAAAVYAIALAASTYLDRFDLLSTQHELFTGINYTDSNFKLPVMNLVIVLLLASSIVALLNGFRFRQPRLIVWPAAAVIGVWIIGVAIIPQVVFSTSVKPNELAKEAPFIEHNIRQTREAFALDRFEERPPYQPAATLSSADFQAFRETLDNVRLWDRSALKATLSQIQEIRSYYDFNIPDVDRYVVNGKLRQVMLAAREMNVDQLPPQSRNWINQHLIYTHGYGVTMNTVNEFTPEGQPNLILKNMPVESSAPEIRVTRPEIYFGESTRSHVYVRTKPQAATQPEFNYPAADNTDSYTTYEGKAGIEVGGIFRKLALSIFLGDGTNLLLSNYIKSDSRVLIRREIRDRLQQIAPFLLFEEDPYMVVRQDGRLSWIVDGFTTSNQYPYSTSYSVANRGTNYIRNAVKAVIDAYDGDVVLYIFEPDDPIVNAYRQIFPSLFKSRDEMPADLRQHVRYSSLLVDAQARVYTLYHMQNTQTFYNHEDLWAIATAEQPSDNGEAPPMQPYHVLMQMPGEPNPPLEFADILPFTPAGRDRSNMIGWIAGRSDGPHYGKMVVFNFPKNVLVDGPAQIRGRVNQDPQVSAQMTLWSQKGSELLRGNLLVIPVASSLLYVEPFYLQAQGTASKRPELRMVVIATQDRLSAGKNFDEAFRALFPDLSPQQQPPAATVRPAQPQQTVPQEISPQPKPNDAEILRQQIKQLITDYERLNAQGRHQEAGAKLDQMKQLLESPKR